MSEETDQELARQIQALSDLFDKMSRDRHEAGASEYGQAGFLQNDTLMMALEELVDLSNYARYTFIKIALLGVDIENLLAQKEVGPQAFEPMGGEKKK